MDGGAYSISLCIPIISKPDRRCSFSYSKVVGFSRQYKLDGNTWSSQELKIYFSMMHGSGYGYPMFYGDILLWPFALAMIGLENIGLLGRDSESAFLTYRVVL